MFSAEGVERWHSAGRDLERLRPRGDISLIYSHPTQPRLKKKKIELKRGKRRETASAALFIFTGTFQELTAIPSSGKPSLSAIFQTPDAVRNSHCNTCLKNESLICTSTPETVAEQKGRVRQLVNLSSETQLRVVIKSLRKNS